MFENKGFRRKAQNTHRSTQSAQRRERVRDLERGFSLRERLFSAIAWQRNSKNITLIFFAFVLLIALGLPLYFAIKRNISSAVELPIKNVEFKSLGHLSKEDVVAMLGLPDPVLMTDLDRVALEKKLLENLSIAEASVKLELPATLHIEVAERVPVVFVEKENALYSGQRQRMFMDHKGVLFPVDEKLHENFLNSPVWYLQEKDLERVQAGVRVNGKSLEPILRLVRAINAYEVTDIPRVVEIFQPREWKLHLSLEDGCEVMMQVHDVEGQVVRLAAILEHARLQGKRLRSVNVIPVKNPAVIYR